MRRVAVGEVRGDRVAEQEALLRHVADLGAQRLERELADRNAVEQDLALLRVGEPRDEIDQRALAASRRADDGERLSRRHGERHVAQHPARLVPSRRGKVEADVAELERAAAGRRRAARAGVAGERISGSASSTSSSRVIDAAPRWNRFTTQPSAISGQVSMPR